VSAINQLIEDLCPDGVEYAALGDVGEFIRGRRFTKADYVDSGLGSIHYGEVYTAFGTAAHEVRSFVRPELKTKLRLARRGDLVIAATGESVDEVGKAVAWLGDDEVAVHDDCYIYRHDLDPEFVAYFFQSGSFHEQKARYVTESKLARIAGTRLATIRIPVPPREVQRAVVHILSDVEQLHGDLEEELRAELGARTRQYKHYRDLILSRACGGSVELTKLGEVAEVRAGWGFPVAHQGRSAGDLPFYKVSDMNLPGNEVEMTSARNYVSHETAKRLGARPAPAGTIVIPKIGAAIATNKKRILGVEACYDNNVFGIVPGPRLDARYLLCHLQSIDISRFAHNSGAVPSIRKSELVAYEFALPSLPDQLRVADELDGLDGLVTGISSALAQEIAARRKQYEYYRDLLLTFPEKKAAA
jgi:type I restriction enzyme S subunit